MEVTGKQIIHIIPTLSFGGAEKMCIELATHQARDNNVCIFTLYGRKPSWRSLSGMGINELNLNVSGGGSLKTYWNVCKVLWKHKPDVVHGHVGGIIYTLLFGILKMFSGTHCSFVYTFHTVPDKDITPFHRKILGMQMKILGVIPVAISDEIRSKVSSMYRLRPEKVHLISNGVPAPVVSPAFPETEQEVRDLKPTAASKVFIQVARISAVKNQLLLVEAFNRIIDQGRDILLIVIGEVQDQLLFEQIRQRIKNRRIVFLGVKSNVTDYLKCADFLCFTSVYEGLPLAMIEAFANKLVVLSTPFEGVEHIIVNNYNGLIAGGFETEQYSTTITKCLDLPEKEYQEISRNAFTTYMNKYTIDQCVENYYLLYE